MAVMSLHPMFETSSQTAPGLTPPYVQVLLKEVKLVVEQTAPPVGHTGEFWCRRLTNYGHDLMVALVRASACGFSYMETFADPEDAHVSALELLAVVDAQMRQRLETGMPFDTQAVAAMPYLRERAVALDTARLDSELERVLTGLENGYYDEIGRKDPAVIRRVMIARLSGRQRG